VRGRETEREIVRDRQTDRYAQHRYSLAVFQASALHYLRGLCAHKCHCASDLLETTEGERERERERERENEEKW
jgi:hypothetical protein